MARTVPRPWNPVSWRRRAGTCAFVVAALLLALAPQAPATGQEGAAGDDVMLVSGMKPEADGAWTAIASPPRSRSGDTFGTGDFLVTVDGSPVPSGVRPRDPADLAVAVVVHAGVGDGALRAAQGAAVETLLGLPEATRTVVVGTGPRPRVLATLGTDRRAASEAVAAVESDPDASLAPGLVLAADQIKGAARRAIILFGPVGPITSEELPALRERLLEDQVALFTVARAAGTKSFQAAARASGGRAVAVGSPANADALVGAGQSIVIQLASQYLISFRPAERPNLSSRIAIAIRGEPESVAEVPRELLPRPETGQGRGGNGLFGGRDVPWALVGAAGAAVVVLVALMLLIRRRRRRRARAGPAFRVRTTRAVIAAPVKPPDEEAPVDEAPAPPQPSEAPAPPEPTEPTGPPSLVPAGSNGGGPSPEPRPAEAAPARPRAGRAMAPRGGHVDEALDQLETFASRWQPRSQGVFFAHEALAIHRRSGCELSLHELSRATVVEPLDPSVQPVVRTIEALRWSLVRRNQGGRWSDIAVEASAVLRGELDPSELVSGPDPRSSASGDPDRAPGGQLERLRGRRVLDDDLQVREPVRAAAIVRERVLEYQWFGAESEVVSRILVPVLLYDRAPAAVPYLGISSHLGDDTDVSTFYEAATAAADEATRQVIQLRTLRSRYQAELDAEVDDVIELLMSVPVVTAGYLAERLDATPAKVTDLMDDLVSAGVVAPLREPARRGDPAWIAVDVLGVFDRNPITGGTISLTVESAESEIPDRGTPRRRAAPTRPRQLRARPRP